MVSAQQPVHSGGVFPCQPILHLAEHIRVARVGRIFGPDQLQNHVEIATATGDQPAAASAAE